MVVDSHILVVEYSNRFREEEDRLNAGIVQMKRWREVCLVAVESFHFWT